MDDKPMGVGGEILGAGGAAATPEDVRALARRYSLEAVQTLRELLACRGRQAMVAAVASTALYKIGNPDVTKEQLKAMLDELIAEAEKKKR